MKFTTPIPESESSAALAILPKILEINEPVVPLLQYAPAIAVYPAYYHEGLSGARSDCFVRRSVADRLVEAAGLLPTDHHLVILDGWRPLEVQQSLYDRLKSQLLAQGWTEGEAFYEELHRFVARPSHNPERPPRHLTGGAVDLTIAGPNGWLDMGTPFDDFTDRAHTRFFEIHLPRDDQERQIQRNRRLLYHIMIQAGFTNYSDEWWHFDYGNQAWAATCGHDHAFYGGILQVN